MRRIAVVLAVTPAVVLPGCALQEIRSKNEVGPEYRHSGTKGTDEVRWTTETGIELKWDRGVSTGVTYRHRDVDDGSGSDDNGVWLDFSFPLWKAGDKPDALESRVRELERRLATLDALMHTEQHEP